MKKWMLKSEKMTNIREIQKNIKKIQTPNKSGNFEKKCKILRP